MNNIPKKLREEMAKSPAYKICVYHNNYHGWNAKIEWHHNLIYAGKQVQEKWCILPICQDVHRLANHKEVRERLDWIMLNRATDQELEKYSKVENLIEKRDKLNKIHANQKGRPILRSIEF